MPVADAIHTITRRCTRRCSHHRLKSTRPLRHLVVAVTCPAYDFQSLMTSYSDIARSDLKQKVVIAAGSSTANTLMLLGIVGENGGSIDAMDSAFNVVSAAKLMR